MKQKIPKTIHKSYIITINGQPLDNNFISLKQASNYVKNSVVLNDSVSKVEIIKEIVKHTTLKTFKPVVKQILSSDELDFDVKGEYDE